MARVWPRKGGGGGGGGSRYVFRERERVREIEKEEEKGRESEGVRESKERSGDGYIHVCRKRVRADVREKARGTGGREGG